MNDNYLKNVEAFHACVERWENIKSDNVRSLYIKDLNIARTLLLWIYPPFSDEYSNLINRMPENTNNEALTFPGFGGFSDQKVTHKCGLKITHLMVNKKDPNGSNCFSNISPKTLF